MLKKLLVLLIPLVLVGCGSNLFEGLAQKPAETSVSQMTTDITSELEKAEPSQNVLASQFSQLNEKLITDLNNEKGSELVAYLETLLDNPALPSRDVTEEYKIQLTETHALYGQAILQKNNISILNIVNAASNIDEDSNPYDIFGSLLGRTSSFNIRNLSATNIGASSAVTGDLTEYFDEMTIDLIKAAQSLNYAPENLATTNQSLRGITNILVIVDRVNLVLDVSGNIVSTKDTGLSLQEVIQFVADPEGDTVTQDSISVFATAANEAFEACDFFAENSLENAESDFNQIMIQVGDVDQLYQALIGEISSYEYGPTGFKENIDTESTDQDILDALSYIFPGRDQG